MLKKTITYTDYNGVERTEDFYFNFSQAELTEMELTTKGGFAEYLNRISGAKDSTEIIKAFKDIVLKSYGEKSADGKRFMKSEDISKAFSETEAYTTIFMELATDDKAAADFVNAILPNPEKKPQDHKEPTPKA